MRAVLVLLSLVLLSSTLQANCSYLFKSLIKIDKQRRYLTGLSPKKHIELNNKMILLAQEILLANGIKSQISRSKEFGYSTENNKLIIDMKSQTSNQTFTTYQRIANKLKINDISFSPYMLTGGILGINSGNNLILGVSFVSDILNNSGLGFVAKHEMRHTLINREKEASSIGTAFDIEYHSGFFLINNSYKTYMSSQEVYTFGMGLRDNINLVLSTWDEMSLLRRLSALHELSVNLLSLRVVNNSVIKRAKRDVKVLKLEMKKLIELDPDIDISKKIFWKTRKLKFHSSRVVSIVDKLRGTTDFSIPDGLFNGKPEQVMSDEESRQALISSLEDLLENLNGKEVSYEDDGIKLTRDGFIASLDFLIQKQSKLYLIAISQKKLMKKINFALVEVLVSKRNAFKKLKKVSQELGRNLLRGIEGN